MQRLVHLTTMIAVAAYWMSIGAVLTLIKQGDHQAASNLLGIIAAATACALALGSLAWAWRQFHARQNRHSRNSSAPKPHDPRGRRQ